MLIKVALIRDVRTPERGHPTDAGIDFFAPQFDKEFIDYMVEQKANDDVKYVGDNPLNVKQIEVPPGRNVLIPSGVKIEIPYGHMGVFLNKSGVASKKDVLIGAQTIDTFYSGEVHIDLHNVGTKAFVIRPNDKIIQMMLVPVICCGVTECSEEILYDEMFQDDYRKENGFGSTEKC